MKTNRIHALDLLRGFALLGILIMNIISFSNIGTGYINPTIGAGIEGINGWIYNWSYLFADMRFMSLFSILFGAGVVLFSNNIKQKGLTPWKYHYRRMFFLIIFGFIHAYLIWMGDILVAYAVCGSITFLFRNKSPKTLFIISGIFFVVPMALSIMNYAFSPSEILNETFAFWSPTQQSIENEIASYTGSYLDQMPYRIQGAIELQTIYFIFENSWHVLSMMLLGMGLYKLDILSALKENSFYKKLFFITFTLGTLISGFGLYEAYSKEWNGVWYMTLGHQYNYLGSLFIALAYVGLVMMWHKSNILNGLKQRLQSVGRLAFTNYILQSVICTLIFYGHGLGLFGTMNRLQQLGIVLSVWLVLLFISPLILKKYRQGPLESLWRKLTYLKSK